MSQAPNSLQRLTLLLAWVVSALIAVGAPAAYFLLAQQGLRKSLESQAELTVSSINGIILSNPKMWRFEEVRLSELLDRRAHDAVPQLWKLYDVDGQLIARNREQVAPPVLSYSQVISDAGVVAGRLQVSRSMRPLLYDTAMTGATSVVLAVALFFVFRSVPLRIIKNAFHDLEESENKYRSLYQTMKEGLALHRVGPAASGGCATLTVIDANPSCTAMFEGDPGGVLGRDSFALLGEEFRDFLPQLLKVVEQGESLTFELSLAGSGKVYNVQAFSPGPALVATLFEDITQRRKSERQIQEMAYHDALTGLPNRALLFDRLNQSIALSRRQQIPLAVMFLDLDRFKQINDTLGHQTGDRLLIEVSRRLQNCIRGSDTLARLGGDEFVMVISNLSQQLDIAIVARNLTELINAPFQINGHELHVTSSIGIALFPDDGDTAEELVKHADMAMYSSKELGRNAFNFYSPVLNHKALARMEAENGLRNALAQEEFFIEYQPIVSTQTHAVVAAEALVRWRHPTRGLVAPDEFICQAEENGLILPLGEWLLRRVCRQMRAWADAGLPRIRFCVNVSSKQIQKQDFPAILKGILAETGASAAQLEIELTESCLVTNVAGNIEAVFGMRQWGISIAIDDFGTGYSSLGYIKTLPIDHIKLDRSFIRDLCTNTRDQAIIEAIISMSQKLGIGNIAEGVETAAQAEYFREKGCAEVQGYYFHRPLPAADFEMLLRSLPAAPAAPAARSATFRNSGPAGEAPAAVAPLAVEQVA